MHSSAFISNKAIYEISSNFTILQKRGKRFEAGPWIVCLALNGDVNVLLHSSSMVSAGMSGGLEENPFTLYVSTILTGDMPGELTGLEEVPRQRKELTVS